VLKNTVDLEPVEVQAAAKEKMDALVLSYQHLDSLLDMAREGNTGAVWGQGWHTAEACTVARHPACKAQDQQSAAVARMHSAFWC
jgi:hypothetical protein